MDFLGALRAVALPHIIEILDLFVKDSWTLRKQQSLNTARPAYRTGGVLTGGTLLTIPPAQQSDQTFSYMLFVTDEASGRGRYTLDSIPPNPTTTPPEGLPIFSAGFQIILKGHENIKGFRAMAETGQSLNYTYELFQ